MILVLGLLLIIAGLVLAVINANIVWFPGYSDVYRRDERFAMVLSCTITIVIAVSILASKYGIQGSPFANWSPAIFVLCLPVLLTALPLAIRSSRARGVIQASVATLLGLLVVISGFSIGMLYIPSVLAMLGAAFLARPGVPSGTTPSLPASHKWVWRSQLAGAS